jgi:hypothetical protein
MSEGRAGSDTGGALDSVRGAAEGRGAAGAADGAGFTTADPSGGVDLPRGTADGESEGGGTDELRAGGAAVGDRRGGSPLATRAGATLLPRAGSTLGATKSAGTDGCGGMLTPRASERGIQLGARVESEAGGG